MQASIIIPTLNCAKYLKNALISAINQSFPKNEYEIIVVDNNSTDETPEVVAELNMTGNKEIIYIKEPNIGLHNARHAGAKIAKGEILVFTDDDAICDRDWLKEILEPYDSDTVGLVGGKVLPKWEVEPPDWIRKYFYGNYLSLFDLGDEIVETTGAVGVNYSIRRCLLFELKGFNPDSFGDIWLGDGESGLNQKALDKGYKIIYNPYAIVWHVIPPTRLTQKYMNKRAENQGASESYTLYKRNPSKIRLIQKIIKEMYKSMFFYGLFLVGRLLKIDYWHVLKTEVLCSWGRAKYDFRLIYDKERGGMVLREDWINE